MIGKRTLAVAMVGCLILSIFMMMGPAAAKTNDPEDVIPHEWGEREVNDQRDLIAGQHIEIGHVEIWNIENTLYVKFVIEDDPEIAGDEWFMTSTKVSVKGEASSLPMTKNGNPIPGKFESKNYFTSPGVQESLHILDMTEVLWWKQGKMPVIAAHADACRYGGLMGLEMALPEDPVSIMVEYPYAGGPSYFPELMVSNGGFLDGTYLGWCIDTDRTINQNQLYSAMVYSSMEALPMGAVEHPENMDLVNWILNQGFVNKMSPGGFGMYTYGDVQKAIWTLVDDVNNAAGLGEWNQNRVNEILAAAHASGEGFIPSCGQIAALVFVPISTLGGIVSQVIIGQVVIGQFGIPCYCQCETAWGEGKTFKEGFGASQWGMYIETGVPMAD